MPQIILNKGLVAGGFFGKGVWLIWNDRATLVYDDEPSSFVPRRAKEAIARTSSSRICIFAVVGGSCTGLTPESLSSTAMASNESKTDNTGSVWRAARKCEHSNLIGHTGATSVTELYGTVPDLGKKNHQLCEPIWKIFFWNFDFELHLFGTRHIYNKSIASNQLEKRIAFKIFCHTIVYPERSSKTPINLI